MTLAGNFFPLQYTYKSQAGWWGNRTLWPNFFHHLKGDTRPPDLLLGLTYLLNSGEYKIHIVKQLQSMHMHKKSNMDLLFVVVDINLKFV